MILGRLHGSRPSGTYSGRSTYHSPIIYLTTMDLASVDRNFSGAHLGKTGKWIVLNFPMYTSSPEPLTMFFSNLIATKCGFGN